MYPLAMNANRTKLIIPSKISLILPYCYPSHPWTKMVAERHYQLTCRILSNGKKAWIWYVLWAHPSQFGAFNPPPSNYPSLPLGPILSPELCIVVKRLFDLPSLRHLLIIMHLNPFTLSILSCLQIMTFISYYLSWIQFIETNRLELFPWSLGNVLTFCTCNCWFSYRHKVTTYANIG